MRHARNVRVQIGKTAPIAGVTLRYLHTKDVYVIHQTYYGKLHRDISATPRLQITSTDKLKSYIHQCDGVVEREKE